MRKKRKGNQSRSAQKQTRKAPPLGEVLRRQATISFCMRQHNLEKGEDLTDRYQPTANFKNRSQKQIDAAETKRESNNRSWRRCKAGTSEIEVWRLKLLEDDCPGAADLYKNNFWSLFGSKRLSDQDLIKLITSSLPPHLVGRLLSYYTEGLSSTYMPSRFGSDDILQVPGTLDGVTALLAHSVLLLRSGKRESASDSAVDAGRLFVRVMGDRLTTVTMDSIWPRLWRRYLRRLAPETHMQPEAKGPGAWKRYFDEYHLVKDTCISLGLALSSDTEIADFMALADGRLFHTVLNVAETMKKYRNHNRRMRPGKPLMILMKYYLVLRAAKKSSLRDFGPEDYLAFHQMMHQELVDASNVWVRQQLRREKLFNKVTNYGGLYGFFIQVTFLVLPQFILGNNLTIQCFRDRAA